MTLPTPTLEHLADLTVHVAAPVEAGIIIGLNSRGRRRIRGSTEPASDSRAGARR